MIKITLELLKNCANNLMFDMKEEEYETLDKEFDTLIKQMSLMDDIEGINDVEPMTFPFKNKDVKLRSDIASSTLTSEEALKNAKETVYGEVKVPKIVGGVH